MQWKSRLQTRIGWTRQFGKAAILGEEATLSKNLNHPNRIGWHSQLGMGRKSVVSVWTITWPCSYLWIVVVSPWWAAASVGQLQALSLKRAWPMRLTAALILFWWLGKDKIELPAIKHFASCSGMQKGCNKRNLQFNSSSKRKKSTSSASRRPISTARTDSPSGDMKYTVLTKQTGPKVECLHLSKPAYNPQRSRD